ncbi:MAG TPA: SURF1 family protein, partial [Burkholderiales bacterium]|nr:SURF1 family protein [Burkholderiales bacterium]
TIALGNWQLGRAHEKATLAERIATARHDAPVGLSASPVNADDLVWRRVAVQGVFEPRYAVLIDNRIVRGVVGYNVVMPLKIEGGEGYVLVNRGWVAGTGTRGVLPQVATPGKAVHITGMATVPSRRYLELSTQTIEGNVWQNLTFERYRAAFPIALQPIVIQQESELDDGLVREWSPPDLGIDKHYAYAFQWFVMAAAILAIYLTLNVKRTGR